MNPPQNWPGCKARVDEPSKVGKLKLEEKENHVEKKRIISIKSNQFFFFGSILSFFLSFSSSNYCFQPPFLNPSDKHFNLLSFLQFPISLCFSFPPFPQFFFNHPLFPPFSPRIHPPTPRVFLHPIEIKGFLGSDLW